MNLITGAAGSQNLFGLGGDDRLDGDAGAGTMAGGTGNDLCVVDDASDVLIEAAGESSDTIESLIDFTLADGFEVLTLIAPGLNGTGNDGLNSLNGSDGDDIVTDFKVNEDIFLAFRFGFASGTDMLALARKSGADTIVDRPGGSTVTITSAALATLDAADFTVGQSTCPFYCGAQFPLTMPK